MVTSYQKEVYELLPKDFTRIQVLTLCTQLDIKPASGVSYIHAWVKRKLIEQVSRGQYKKNGPFVAGKVGVHIIKEAQPIQKMEKEEAKEEDAVLTTTFAVDSATDDELLSELCKRGFSWTDMRKTVITTFPFKDYCTVPA